MKKTTTNTSCSLFAHLPQPAQRKAVGQHEHLDGVLVGRQRHGVGHDLSVNIDGKGEKNK